MPKKQHTQTSEGGFILVVTMMILVVLTLIAVSMTRNTSIELQIAGNDKLHKQAFTEADGGTEFAAEILEQNIACLDFAVSGAGSTLVPGSTDGDIKIDNNIAVEGGSLKFWQNGLGHWSSASEKYPADDQREAGSKDIAFKTISAKPRET